MKRLVAAIRFLTILPLPGRWGTEEADLAGSVVFFPIVGLLIGAVVAALAFGLVHILPPAVVSVLIVIALAAVSGGLHLDGLSDTADGFLSARSRERALEIMKDSHVGAMGVIATVCVLFFKVAVVASIPSGELWRGVILMPLAGRCALVISIFALPYARPEGGLGTVFYRRRSVVAAVWAVAILAGVGWLAAGWAGLIAAAGAVVVTLLFAAWCHRRIGGTTGDTLGAACELGELAPALALAGWYFSTGGVT